MSNHKKKIWVRAVRLDQIEGDEAIDNLPAPGPLKEVWLMESDSPSQVTQHIRTALRVKDETLILKLRNHRGSLIVMSGKLAANSKSVPYTVEVTRPHQTVSATPSTVPRTKQEEALRGILRQTLARLDKLEFESQNINEKKTERITKAMSEISQTLDFLNRRIGVAESTKWQGMFKKNPLW